MKKSWLSHKFFMLCMLLILLFASSCSSLKLERVGMASAVSKEGEPLDKISVYYSNSPEFIAYALLTNAPVGTRVRFVWKYLTVPTNITEMTVLVDNPAEKFVHSTLKADTAWALGDYLVQIYIDDRKKPDGYADFKIIETE